MPTYNIMLVGDPGVGKSAFARRLQTDTFQETCLKSKVTKIGPNSDGVVFDIWESSMDSHVFHHGAHAAIVMFSVDTLGSYKSVPAWVRRIRKRRGNIPIVVCANKADKRDRVVMGSQVSELQDPFVYPIETSVKTGYHVNQALELLFQKLTAPTVSVSEELCAVASEILADHVARLKAATLAATKLEIVEREIAKQEAAKLEADKLTAAKRKIAKQEAAKLTAAKLEAAKQEAATRDRVAKRGEVALLIEKMNRATDMLMQAYRLGENDDHPALVDLNIAEAKKILNTLA